MFTNIDEALNWVTARRNTGHTFAKFKEVCSGIGDPQNNFYTIHVAGTNGKGSTVSYLRDLLMSQGYKVGTLQSPHYITHLDRIRVNNQNIPAETFLSLLNKYYDWFVLNDLSMFEIDYLIMCYYFEQEKVDFAIVEVGIGGRLDATNVVDNTKLSIITTIGFDHMELLGDTLPKICKEKCGIIKQNSKILTGFLDPSCNSVVQEEARKNRSKFYELDEFDILDDRKFRYQNEEYEIASYAKYQIHNACLALKAFKLVSEDVGFSIDINKAKDALSKTIWQNRFEIVKENPRVILDGAHNPHGIEAAVSSFKQFKGSKCIVFSALRRKDYKNMVEILDRSCDELVITSFDNTGVIDIGEFDNHKTYKNYIEAIDYAIANYENILVCGSLYFLSDVVLNYKFN